MSFSRIAGGALLLLLVTACVAPRTQTPDVDPDLVAAEAARQKEFVLRDWLASQERLNRIAYPLLAGAVPLCGETVRASIGALATNSQSFLPDYRAAAAAVIGGDDRLRLVHVIDGFPAAEAGLAVGDLIVSVNGVAAPRGENAIEEWLERLDDLLDDGGPFTMTVLRDGEQRTVRIEPRTICDYPVHFNPSGVINAYADGKALHVNAGMLRFAADDQELAMAIAHEIAHNAMGHIQAMQSNTMAGGLGGLILDVLAAVGGINTGGVFSQAGAQAAGSTYSVAFEKEADYVGLYIMANAGLEIEGAANFWRRMATANPGSIELAETHPTSPDRFLAVEQTIEEIKLKRELGLPLMPAMKSP